MGKVELSLQEYNNLMSTLGQYQEIVSAFINPTISDWDLGWYKGHPDNPMTVHAGINLSTGAQRILANRIQENVSNYIKDNNIEGEFKFDIKDMDIKLGSISHIKEESVEDTEE